jgi:hypothetical protein
MAQLGTKSPRDNYATRQADAKPNIGHPGSTAARQQDQARAQVEEADQQLAATATAIDGTNLRADIDAAMVAQGATACNNAGARAAVAAVVTDALIGSRTVQTVKPTTTLVAAR